MGPLRKHQKKYYHRDLFQAKLEEEEQEYILQIKKKSLIKLLLGEENFEKNLQL
jgi:hypothetical protein